MINKSVDESIFEAVLAQAFLEASEKDLEQIIKEGQKTLEYSEKFQKIERKKYDKICRETYTTPFWVTSLKRAASFILIIGFTCSIIMFSAPTIRADFFNLATEFFEKYFSISLANKTSGYETSDYIFKYIYLIIWLTLKSMKILFRLFIHLHRLTGKNMFRYIFNKDVLIRHNMIMNTHILKTSRLTDIVDIL